MKYVFNQTYHEVKVRTFCLLPFMHFSPDVFKKMQKRVYICIMYVYN